MELYPFSHFFPSFKLWGQFYLNEKFQVPNLDFLEDILFP